MRKIYWEFDNSGFYWDLCFGLKYIDSIGVKYDLKKSYRIYPYPFERQTIYLEDLNDAKHVLTVLNLSKLEGNK